MKNKITTKIVMIFLLCLFCAACQDSFWEDHYQINNSGNDITLMQALESHSEFSSFCNVLRHTGIDSILNSSQTFTVWAPTNDAMTGYSKNDKSIDQLLKNHIARFVYNTADLADTAMVRVKMLNGKYQEFSRGTGNYTFAENNLNNQSWIASNGVLHSIQGRAPFYYNIWETIKVGNNTDSIAKYLTSFDKYTFLANASTAIGQNDLGQTVYDSVFDYRNNWLRKYGSLYLEDSVYTALVPTNNAWNKAYAKIKPYFKTFGALVQDNSNSSSIIVKRTYQISSAFADSLHDAHTRQNLAQDLIFRKKVNPYNAPGDSLISTSGNVFYSPSYLFDGTTKSAVSNGSVYITDELKHNPLESWHKKILVEAESSVGRTYNYATLASRSSSETAFKDLVSEMKYIEVINTSTNATLQPQISFDIPNTLAAKYNIYVVFAPPTAFDEDIALDSTKVKFYLNYVHTDGTMKEDMSINVDPVTNKEFITNGAKMTSFLVAKNFEFPFANYVQSPFANGEKQTTNVKIRVVTNVAAKETTQYVRKMRIDCLILEPVNE